MTISSISNTISSVAPSVDIAYHSLEAYVACPSGATLARGKPYNTTIAYAPKDLSTAMSARAQQTECTYISVNYTMLGDYSSSDNPDFFLSIPSSLTSLDPAWTTCTPALYGAWDPPRTLPTATALTGSANKIRPSPPAAPASRSTPVYAPATPTAAANRPTDATPSVASVPNTPQTSNLPKTSAAEAANSAIKQDSHSTAALRIPSKTIPRMPSGEDGKPDLSDPSKVSSVSGPPLIGAESFVQAPSGGAEVPGSVAQISGQDLSIASSAVIMSGSTFILPPPSAPTLTLPLINGKPMTRASGGGLVFASSTVARGSQATISGHDISLGLSDAVIDGSKHALPMGTAENTQLSPVTLANGIVATPDGDPNKLKIGNQIISVNEPAITISGTAVSLGPSGLYIGSSVLTLTAATNNSNSELRSPTVSAFQSGPSPAGTGSNDSNAVVFTGGIPRSPHLYSISVVTLIVATFAMIALAS